LGNLIGTHREDEGNNKGKKKQKKKKTPAPFLPRKGKKNLDPSLWVHPEPFIGCMKLFLFPKLFATIFGLS
jgi:hypothetical protein